MKQEIRIPYFKIIRGKKRNTYHFSPPAYVVKTVYEQSNEKIHLRGKVLSSDFNEAVQEAKTIYEEQIKPYLKRTQNKTACKQSLNYIWIEFCKRRGIGYPAKENILLDKKLSPRTKKDYQKSFNHIQKIKNKYGKKLVDLNFDMITPMLVDDIYLKLFDICKERWAHNGIDLLRLLFNFGKEKLGVLKNNNPFINKRYPKTKYPKKLWTKQTVTLFDTYAQKLGFNDVGLAVRLNFYMGQRPADILSLTMEQLKTKEGMAYFEIMPHKTEGRGVISYAPIPKELYEEIKNRTGKLLRQRKGKEYTAKTFEKHFQKIRKMDERLTGLSFQATRNSASTAYYESGSSVGQNMTILGHTQEQTNLSIYRQNTPKQAIEALKRRLQEEEKNK